MKFHKLHSKTFNKEILVNFSLVTHVGVNLNGVTVISFLEEEDAILVAEDFEDIELLLLDQKEDTQIS